MDTQNSIPPKVGARQRQTGLRRALFFALILALVLPGVLAGSVLIYLNLQRTVEVDARVRAEKFADFLQAGLTLPLWQVAPESAIALLEAVAADPSVAAIEVLGPERESVLEHHRQEVSRTDAIIINRKIEKSGEPLGEVTITYATTTARENAMYASFLLLTVIAVQLLVSVGILGAWLTRRVLTPLDVLRESAEVITAGDLQSKVPDLPKDEFGLLAADLEFMRDSLQQSVSQLEERVDARTRELKQVNAQLQDTLQHLQQAQNCLIQSEKLASLGALVAGVAHELNTPIGTGITLVSTILSKSTELRRQLNAGLRRSQLDSFLNDVDDCGSLALSSLEKAAHLVLDFKQVAVDQTSSRRRTFDLAAMSREMMAALSIRFKHSPAQIDVRIPPDIMMDSYPGAVEQVLTNLVENAIIHGFEGRSNCRIDIEAFAIDGHVNLTIADNGSGIAADQLSRIFDPFFTTRLGKGGSGLGLSIAYSLVNGMLGGQISVASVSGEGTVFTLNIPLLAPARPEIA